MPRQRPRAPIVLGLILAFGCASGARPDDPPKLERLEASRSLRAARKLAHAGEFARAREMTAQGLAAQPREPHLLRLSADLHERLGSEQAKASRELANTVDPRGARPAEWVPRASGTLLVLLAPHNDAPGARETDDRKPRSWSGPVGSSVADHLRGRLSGATVVSGQFPSVSVARQRIAGDRPTHVLSVRIDRSKCRFGFTSPLSFSMARVRVAVTAAESGETVVREIKEVIPDPPWELDCPAHAAVAVLEVALRDPVIRSALDTNAGADAPTARWASGSIRALLPHLDEAVRAAIREGTSRLAAGQLHHASQSAARARQLDPDDVDAGELARQIELSRQLALALSTLPAGSHPATGATEATGSVAEPSPSDAVGLPRLDPSERADFEAWIAAENDRKTILVATLAALRHEESTPSTDFVRNLPRVEHANGAGSAFASELLRERGRAVAGEHAASAPDGSQIARYYVLEPRAGTTDGPNDQLLVEKDEDGDGRAERWVLFSNGSRLEAWQDRRESGRPDAHWTFEADGNTVSRVEVDSEGVGRWDRTFVYSAGRLDLDSRDTNGDGRADRFDRFDDTGSLLVREEDRDFDGEIDVRSHFHQGRVVRRQLFSEPGP